MSECVREKERERSRVDGTYVLVYVHLEGLRSTEEIKKMLLLLLLKSHSSFTHSLTHYLSHSLPLSLSLSLTHTLTRWRYFPLSLSVVILRSQQITNHSMSISWPDLTWVSHMPTLKLLWLFKELLLLSLSLTHTHNLSLSLTLSPSLKIWSIVMCVGQNSNDPKQQHQKRV